MAFPKNISFPESDQQIGSMGRAIGHPARSYILRLLEREGPLFVHQIVSRIPLSEGAVTAHLRVLRLSGLVEVEVSKLYNSYSLSISGLRLYRSIKVGFLDDLIKDGAELSQTRGSTEESIVRG